MITERRESECPSCGGDRLAQILHWPSVPVNASLFPETLEASLAVARGSFRLVACAMCGLLFNADFDESLVEYSPSCIETQAGSATHRTYADSLAGAWIERHGLRGATVVEVGAGFDAGFLARLVELGSGSGVAIDPALAGGADHPASIVALAERFGPEHAAIGGSALVCRHTLEHISDIRAFLAATRSWAVANGDAPVLFEVPDAGRILAEDAFWDMYYEHCSYFDAETLAAAFRLHGLAPERVEHVYDGQYLVLEARPSGPQPPAPALAEATAAAAHAFATRVEASIATAADRLATIGAHRRIAVWQAGGKALALLVLTGAVDLVTAVVDVNAAKRGRFLPGTRHAIRAPADLRELRPDVVVLMNPIYLAEVRETLASLGVEAEVLTVDRLMR
jgi:hypothetical protein